MPCSVSLYRIHRCLWPRQAVSYCQLGCGVSNSGLKKLEVLCFLKLYIIFVGPKLCQSLKYKKIILTYFFFYKIKIFFYPRVRNSTTHLTLLCKGICLWTQMIRENSNASISSSAVHTTLSLVLTSLVQYWFKGSRTINPTM